ncbi:hypothetical protein BG005_010869 [Podila minutissima]|nr:hypothetical protein BG005_010869 [Podila minutissima]
MSNSSRPKVIIVGAGIGGLTLGILLEKAGVPFEIVERSASTTPMGSSIALGCNVRNVFEQIGLWEEFVKVGKPTFVMNISDQQRQQICQIDFHAQGELSSTDMYALSRPVFHEMLLRRVPAERLHYGKKVTSIVQGSSGVAIHTSDNSTYEGDILVGADGANSIVRQSMYEKLYKEGKLPCSDNEPLSFKTIALIGQTSPLNKEQFPEILREDSPFECTVGENNYGANTICWQAFLTLDKTASKAHDSFRNSEWGPEAAEQMCKDVKDIPFKGGNGNLTIGDLIERSPKDRLTKVVFEEKIFKTWSFGRTVLLGDSKSKLHPAGGMGAAIAIQDAVTLANWINVLPGDVGEDDLAKVFRAYKKERLPEILGRNRISQTNAALLGKTLQGKAARYILNNLPKLIIEKAAYDNVRSRPQVSFLPLVEDGGKIPASPQPSLDKTLEILKKREKAAAVAATARPVASV